MIVTVASQKTRLLLAGICIALLTAMALTHRDLLAQEQEFDQSTVRFISLLFSEDPELQGHLTYIGESWQPGYEAMALDILRLTSRPDVVYPLFDLLRSNTGESIGNSTRDWYQWLWNRPSEPYDGYAGFKSALYRLIDPKFEHYFSRDRAATIRLDEVVWGGVAQDGIPPLREPAMISADQATYLEDGNVVFGVAIDGDVRAYPKRILAWHEMFIDRIAGAEYAGVYCILCGAVIMYETAVGETRHELGTSGFLYRSNKLMYDRATQSLWNTTWGRPVVGPLAGQGIELKRSHVVTTTWGEWRRRHPDSLVLSLDTGHARDYGEGIAYNDYFSTDELMFSVPRLDSRLRNKDEVLALYFPAESDETLAIAADYLLKNPVYHDRLGTMDFVVLTDPTGANRVYRSNGKEFARFDGDDEVTDVSGVAWRMTEDRLESTQGEVRPRLAAHRAFWFGWYAANNDTRLVH